MPRSSFLPARTRSAAPDATDAPDQRALARRALVEAPNQSGRWLRRGVAVLAVSVLGVGTASSVVLTGNAERTLAGVPVTAPAPQVEVSLAPGVRQPVAFTRESASQAARATAAERPDRTAGRPALDRPINSATLLRARATALRVQAAAAKKRADQLAKKKAAQLAKKKAAEAAERKAERARRKALVGDGKPVLPVAGARTAAGFGATGAWARYHTGIDFSAGSGTTVRAPRAGEVTSSGSGQASGWAGTYVTIRHSDGTQSLYAHLSGTSVSDGQQVNAGDVVGQVGQTGRAFGPHLHFEVYPAGVEPGDVYQAVNPAPWLRDLGLDY
jgi:murein DD-endopeptidase MepM/ murein hydrolase activator NlpD